MFNFNGYHVLNNVLRHWGNKVVKQQTDSAHMEFTF